MSAASSVLEEFAWLVECLTAIPDLRKARGKDHLLAVLAALDGP